MLTITRRLNEALFITTPSGDTIDILVTRVGKQISLAIGAPDSFKILREELLSKPKVKFNKEKSNCA